MVSLVYVFFCSLEQSHYSREIKNISYQNSLADDDYYYYYYLLINLLFIYQVIASSLLIFLPLQFLKVCVKSSKTLDINVRKRYCI